jgi:DNA-directed RNA polymerase specialized sigma24 family protein
LTTYFSLPHVPTQKQAAPGLRPGELANDVSVPGRALDVENIADEQAVLADDELLRAEWYAAITDLPPPCQRLIALLAEDPPLPYAQISARLGIPVGSIGPTRRRCLAKLRRHPAIAALTSVEPASVEK